MADSDNSRSLANVTPKRLTSMPPRLGISFFSSPKLDPLPAVEAALPPYNSSLVTTHFRKNL
jgi:hypothetical protein